MSTELIRPRVQPEVFKIDDQHTYTIFNHEQNFIGDSELCNALDVKHYLSIMEQRKAILTVNQNFDY